MKPIEVSDNFNVPNIKDLDKIWSDIHFKAIKRKFEFVRLLEEYGQYTGLIFKGFQFEENDIFDWYCSRGTLDSIDFNNRFLLSDKVLKEFPTLTYNNLWGRSFRQAYPIEKKPEFHWVDEFCIDGELASLLYHGGAHRKVYPRTPKEIKHLAQAFCNELFEEDYKYQSVRCFKSITSWNSWFTDFVLDETFLIICMKSRTIWILAITDNP